MSAVDPSELSDRLLEAESRKWELADRLNEAAQRGHVSLPALHDHLLADAARKIDDWYLELNAKEIAQLSSLARWRPVFEVAGCTCGPARVEIVFGGGLGPHLAGCPAENTSEGGGE